MEDKIREIIFSKFSNTYSIHQHYGEDKYYILSEEYLEKATQDLSNLISNQDRIDCYSKTGEVISNDKEIRAIEINSTDNKAKNLTGTNLSNDKGKDKPDSCHWQKWQELGSLIDDVLPGDKLPDSIFNAVKKMQKKLSNDKGEIIASGKLFYGENFMTYSNYYIWTKNKQQINLSPALNDRMKKYNNQNIKITITKGE